MRLAGASISISCQYIDSHAQYTIFGNNLHYELHYELVLDELVKRTCSRAFERFILAIFKRVDGLLSARGNRGDICAHSLAASAQASPAVLI